MSEIDRPIRRSPSLAVLAILLLLPAVATRIACGDEIPVWADLIPDVSNWTDESFAQGNPRCDPPCDCDDSDYAFSDSGPGYLMASRMRTFTLPANQAITGVQVNVLCRYRSSKPGRVKMRVRYNGVEIAAPESDTFSSDTRCRYRMRSRGDITGLRERWTQADIRALTVGVRRFETPSVRLRVKALRITVTTAPDRDNDGCPDATDGCPDDREKCAPGVCGCGVPDVDTDGDGCLDCVDDCPDDRNKCHPGLCGCGNPEETGDRDGDGCIDCLDRCPDDENKCHPGLCGCGEPEETGDRDNDGCIDCRDQCPDDPEKCEDPGECGCGEPETDTDGDGCVDCVDDWPLDPNGGCYGEGEGGGDYDGDGVFDSDDDDNDNDGVDDRLDPSVYDRFVCGDSDQDGCDDCASGRFRPANDCDPSPAPIRIVTEGRFAPPATREFLDVELTLTTVTPGLVEWTLPHPVERVLRLDGPTALGHDYRVTVGLRNVPPGDACGVLAQSAWGLSFSAQGVTQGLQGPQRLISAFDIGDDDDGESLFGNNITESAVVFELGAGRGGECPTAVEHGTPPNYGMGNGLIGVYQPTGVEDQGIDASAGWFEVGPPYCTALARPWCTEEPDPAFDRNTFMFVRANPGDSNTVTVRFDQIVLRFETPWRDCNGNGEWDTYDIENGSSADVDGDGVPDECQERGDIDGNGVVDFADMLLLLAAWGDCDGCPEDVNGDGTVDVADVLIVLGDWT